MPFDGKMKPTCIEKLKILESLCSHNQTFNQCSFTSCLWFEARNHPRLIELGVPQDPQFDDSRGCQILAFFTEGTVPVDYATVINIFGPHPKRSKIGYVRELLAKAREQELAAV